MTASDKLFHWLFQSQPDRILQLLPELAAAEAGGYRFMAPVFKALEHRPDGVFLAVDEASALPALVLEAQMWADPEFFLRIYAESGRFLQQRKTIRRWQVVVICPRRTLAFGDPEPVAEFLEHRVRWLELQPALADPNAPPLRCPHRQAGGPHPRPAAARAGSAGRSPARLSGRGRPQRLAGGGLSWQGITRQSGAGWGEQVGILIARTSSATS